MKMDLSIHTYTYTYIYIYILRHGGGQSSEISLYLVKRAFNKQNVEIHKQKWLLNQVKLEQDGENGDHCVGCSKDG